MANEWSLSLDVYGIITIKVGLFSGTLTFPVGQVISWISDASGVQPNGVPHEGRAVLRRYGQLELATPVALVKLLQNKSFSFFIQTIGHV